MSEVTLTARMVGTDLVISGFQRMGDAVANMGDKAAEGGKKMETSYKSLMVTTAGLIGNSVQLGDIMDRMAKGQLDVGKGALMLSMNFLQLISQLSTLNTTYGKKIAVQATSIALDIKEAAADVGAAISKGVHTAASWALTAAKKAEIIALGIANTLSGPYGWAILAGAAAAAVGVYALAESIPSKQSGGPVHETGPYLLHAGEYVLPRGASSITVNVYGAGSPRETGDAVVDALRRSGVI